MRTVCCLLALIGYGVVLLFSVVWAFTAGVIMLLMGMVCMTCMTPLLALWLGQACLLRDLWSDTWLDRCIESCLGHMFQTEEALEPMMTAPMHLLADRLITNWTAFTQTD